jgi:tetratricopeptide (TPR) repeat protein
MSMNPYAPCPCGSGKQFKWCCQPYYGLVEKALHLHEQGQHAAAEQAVTQLVEKHPKIPQAWGYQAEVFFLNDKPERADAALQKAFELDPNFAYGHWLRGLMRLNEGEVVGALLLFRKTAELLDPNAKGILAQVNARVAELELQNNRPVAAREAMRRAIDAAPQTQELRQAFDSVFGPDSRLPLAARQEYALRPTSAAQPAEAANLARLTQAVQVHEAFAQQNASDPAAWFNIGVLRAWLGDNQRAIEALVKSEELDTDEGQAAEAGALVEILRCGHGLEALADFVEHRAYLEIRDPDAVGTLLGDWGRSGRLLIVNADRENGFFSGLVLEDEPDFGVNVGTPVAKLQSYMLLEGMAVRFWHPNRESLDKVVAELRDKVQLGVAEPQYEVGAAQFSDVVAGIMLFPTKPGADPEAVEQKMKDRSREFFEETWINRRLKALDGTSPLDAAAHPTLKKRLPGLIRFMEQCLLGVNPREEGKAPTVLYDFDRLRRKLGLTTAPAAAGAAIDFDTLSPAGLADLKPDALSDEDVGRAFRAANKLDASDLATTFAKAAVGRESLADRYQFFSHLIRSARDEGNAAEELRWHEAGEQADAATNEARRRDDYALGRGRALARQGKVNEAYSVFKEVIGRSGNTLAVYGPAAEAMLGRNEPKLALEFAESGLAVARKQNSRDGEQQFLELVEAAKKRMG